MKRCGTCDTDKEVSEFNKNKSKPDGLNTICKDCSKEKSKNYYNENREHHKKVIRKRSNRIKQENRVKMLEILKKSSCADCGGTDFRVLEFDHVRGKKRQHVSVMVGCGWAWKQIEEEIKKCDIVCANCHRIRTFKRCSSYRTK